MKREKKSAGGLKWYVLGALILLCLLYFAVPSVNAYVNRAAAVLGSANVDAVVDYIRSYGPYAMAISFALMVFSSVVAPLPAFLITVLHVPGEHPAHVGVDHRGGQLADPRGQEEGGEGHRREAGKVAHRVKGHKGQQPADEDGPAAVLGKVVLHAGQGPPAGEPLHRVPAQGPGDEEAEGRPGHGAAP